MRKSLSKIAVPAITLALLAGCTVEFRPPGVAVQAPEPPPAPEVQVDAGPVVVDPSVVAIDVEPAPELRVYAYDPGFPPGTYFYNGFYWYGGYRYPHDVFINRYVTVNVREHRFIDVAANRRRGEVLEREHRQEFARTGGHVNAAVVRQRQEDAKHPEAARQRQQQAQQQHQQQQQQHQQAQQQQHQQQQQQRQAAQTPPKKNNK